jgi:3-dehydroquinate synthetase
MLTDLEAFDPANRSPEPDLLARNIAIKARIVEEDERETSGTRALLNFGHTIGHAIEASVPYGQFLHGEAISLGMRAALYLSEKVTGLPAGDSARILALLRHFGLPLSLPASVSDEAVCTRMAHDKKFAGGTRRFVLLEKAGAAVLSTAVTEEQVREALALLRNEPD